MSVKYKIKKETPTNINNLVKISINKPSLRKKLHSPPVLKKWNCDKSPSVLTRSDLRKLLFNC